MAEITKSIKDKLEKIDSPIREICEELISFSKNMPEQAVKQHLDTIIRKSMKQRG